MARTIAVRCDRCRGGGLIANTDAGEPWVDWLSLPLESAIAVVAGIVTPIPCPVCVGAGITSQQLPTTVCLCGSTRFWREFQRYSLAETLAGKIVLSIGAASGTDDEQFGNLPRDEYDRVKAELEELHLRKIDLCDEVFVLNVGGYIGPSTSREVWHAKRRGKPIRYLEPVEEV